MLLTCLILKISVHIIEKNKGQLQQFLDVFYILATTFVYRKLQMKIFTFSLRLILKLSDNSMFYVMNF